MASIAALSASAVAQPGNNTCGVNRAAYTIPPQGGTVFGSLILATRDGSACAGSTGSDVYYYFTPTAPGPWRLSLCTTSPVFDSVLSIHTDSCPVSSANYATPAMPQMSCNDEGSGCLTGLSQISSVPLTPGTPYIIRVARFSGTFDATFTLQVVNTTSMGACCASNGSCMVQSVSLCNAPSMFLSEGSACSPNPCPQIPSNDLWANSPTFSGPGLDTTGTTVLAGTDGSAACVTSSSRDVWYRFTPSATAAYSVSLCSSSAPWDAVLSVHSAGPGTLLNQLGGACNDDGCTGAIGLAAIPSVSLSGGVTYTIRVAGYGSAGSNAGPFRLIVGPPLGRCCAAADGACSVVEESVCPSGDQWTLGATCTASACDGLRGACCDPDSGSCALTFQSQCTAGLVFSGTGTSCSPNPCPSPPQGACCNGAGCCQWTTLATCVGAFSVGVPCLPNPCVPPPANDSCSGAAPIQIGVLTIGNSCAATDAGDGPDPACAFNGPGNSHLGMWYLFDAPAAAAYSISTCGSDHDTILTVFDGGGGGGCGVLTPVACNDDASPACAVGSIWAAEIASVPVSAPGPLLIRVSAWGQTPSGGMFMLMVQPTSPLGSCCDLTGVCNPTDAASCAPGSTFLAGGSCTPNNCVVPVGACCAPAGTCSQTTMLVCMDSFLGIGATCEPNPCPQPLEACCAADGSCTLQTSQNCVGLGLGENSTCEPNLCPQPTGACCWPNGNCSIAESESCGGVFQTVGSVCSPNPCPQPMGACCWPAGGCSMTEANGCGGMFQSIGTSCTPNPCPQPLGACCWPDGNCSLTDQANCGGEFLSVGSVCAPNPCPEPTGACCFGSTCMTSTATACSGANTAFAGVGTVCNVWPDRLAPCCLANFNHQVGVSLQDLFDFLAAYFAASPAADINSSGAVSVQDIFNFLEAYFGGGC